MNAARLFLVVAYLGLSACSGSLRPISASPEDYGQYRALRASESFEARLRAGGIYLHDFPEGRWHAEVRAWFEQAEAKYLERFWDDRSRLAKYLGLVPSSPRSSLVAGRIEVLDASERASQERERAELARAHETERRFAEARKQRAILVATYENWLARIAAIRTWGQPLSQLDPSMARELNEASPTALCNEAACVKSLTLPFAVAEAGQLVERSASLEIEIESHNGAVARARIRGVKLFEYLAEASRKRSLSGAKPQEKTEALALVIGVSNRVLDGVLPRPGCDAEAIPPVLLARSCQGVRLEARVAEGGGDADVIEIAPIPPP